MLQVEHKGKLYGLFDSIQVQNSLDNIAGQYTLRTTLNNTLPFGKGSFIRILADGAYVLSGFVESAKGTITKNSQDITMSGRDLLGDLIDSAVPDTARLTVGSITLPSLCNKVISALKIKSTVKNLAGSIDPFTEKELTSVEFGGKGGDFLQQYARKRQVFLTTFGDGHLILFKPPTSVGYAEKLTADSMFRRDFEYSDKDRFNVVTVGSEDNYSSGDITVAPDDTGVNRQGTATDGDVRSTRVLQFQAEQSMNDAELKSRAEEEINIRRARGFSYTCTVPSHQYKIGTLVRVQDDVAGVTGVFLIRSVIYLADGKGNTSQLTLCFPETYTGTGKRVSEKKSKMDEKPVRIAVNPSFRLRTGNLYT